ncbi:MULTISPECIES: Sec-independent protein translocase protein TatB [Protofrankia]|uniref:Twin-arginine translocation protein, TatB subunit n=2 Tax=Candidatus Protofrankia datiscae TaxID=2716812 RepID=F8AWG5_9ACTN|nr:MULTISPECIES: Sec-independent protein translocase protein TatB [Protofrankia]AEH08368.1 twin-arginine translocation protein, TatB subunit [Candidatus Protofrankia datiscae]
MFNGVGWGEIAVLMVIGLFVFGPERLPKVARDAGRLLRQIRQAATGMRDELRSELGPEFADLDLRTLHPKTFVRKHLLEDDDPLLPPYLSKRTSFDKMLFDDDSDALPGAAEPPRPRLSYDSGSYEDAAIQVKPTLSLTKASSNETSLAKPSLTKPSLTTSSSGSVSSTSLTKTISGSPGRSGLEVSSGAGGDAPATGGGTAAGQPPAAPFDTDAT